jgi:hypothetical protein
MSHDTSTWCKPHWLTGNGDLVRVGPGAGGSEEHACSSHAAAKARPGLWPVRRLRLPKPELETFALGSVCLGALCGDEWCDRRAEFRTSGVIVAIMVNCRSPAFAGDPKVFVSHAELSHPGWGRPGRV